MCLHGFLDTTCLQAPAGLPILHSLLLNKGLRICSGQSSSNRRSVQSASDKPLSILDLIRDQFMRKAERHICLFLPLLSLFTVSRRSQETYIHFNRQQEVTRIRVVWGDQWGENCLNPFTANCLTTQNGLLRLCQSLQEKGFRGEKHKVNLSREMAGKKLPNL